MNDDFFYFPDTFSDLTFCASDHWVLLIKILNYFHTSWKSADNLLSFAVLLAFADLAIFYNTICES